jgi:hypothetical protein
MDDATDESIAAAAVKRRAYQRQRFKKQFTVRIDEELSKAVIARAEFEGMRLTDAMEEGLWLWVQKKHVTGLAMRGRFLWSVIPLELQKLVEASMVYLSRPKRSAVEEVFRKYWRDILTAYRDDPDYQTGLKELGEVPRAELDE